MTGQLQRVDIKGSVPVPVGHHVEIWILRVSGGIFGDDRVSPAVRHLETGIIYGPSWAYRKESGLILHTAPDSMTFDESVRVISRFTGRVEDCRVATTSSSSLDQVTTLIVSPSEQAPPYR